MSQNPLVSIIINNYNYGCYLGEAIESALGQTYDNIEAIVVDDGSTDDSKHVIGSYKNRVVSVFKDNGGQGSAYNAGFLKSRGEIICNLDADDTLLPEAIERAVPLFEDNKTVKVQWPLRVVDRAGTPCGQITTKWTPPEGNLKETVLRDGPFYDFNLHTGCALKRDFLEKVFPMPELPYRNGADVYLIILVPIFGYISNIMEPLGTYRSHGANNYLGRTLDDKRIRNYIDRFEINCEALHHHLNKMDIEVDPQLWKERNFNYLWPTRLLLAKQDIESYIPEGSKYILVNEDEWGEGEPVPKRHAIPFLEKDGQYAGPPADDAVAIKGLERLRNNGAKFLVFWWTSFWWLEHYKELYRRLRAHFPIISKSDRLVIFDLRQRVESLLEG